MKSTSKQDFCIWAASVFLLCSSARAGTFFCDFNSDLPPGTKLFGDAAIVPAGGVDNSGALRLTTTIPEQIGSFVIDSLDGDKAVASFTATFKFRISDGNGADGFCF